MLALPFTIVALALVVSLYLASAREGAEAEGKARRTAGAELLARLRDDWRYWRSWGDWVIIGALYPMNSWDFPTYLGAAAIAILIGTGPTLAFVEQVAAIGIAAVLAWSPFWVKFVPFSGGTTEGMTLDSRTALHPGEHRHLHRSADLGRRVFDGLGADLDDFDDLPRGPVDRDLDATGRARKHTPQPSWMRGLVVVSVIIVAVAALALPAPVIVLAGIPFALALRLVLLGLDGERGLPMLVSTLFAAGWAITILTEFFFIRDVFNSRYNTLFKIYYQVWTLIGVASAIAIVLLSAQRPRSPKRRCSCRSRRRWRLGLSTR